MTSDSGFHGAVVRLSLGLFAAGLFLVPFDAVRGLSFLGELGHEASFYFFAPAIGLAAAGALIADRRAPRRSRVLWIAAAAFVVIALSFFANADAILSAAARERTGINKFTTSAMVIAYGFALAWTVEQFGQETVHPVITRLVSASVVAAIAYLPFEWLGERGYLGGIYEAVEAFIHSRQADVLNAWDGTVNEKVLYGWDDRLRSVSFEPPAFGNFTGLAWPWVLFAALSARGRRRAWSWGLLAVFTLVVIGTANRTGLVLLGVNLIAAVLLATFQARRGVPREALVAARVLAPVVVIVAGLAAATVVYAYRETLVTALVAGESVSNLSRIAFQVAALQMFADSPLIGFGLGQFGLMVAEYLPAWAFRSPEIEPMIVFAEAPWPAAYSLYARLGAELGAIGLAGWIALWLGLALALARRGSAHGLHPMAHWPVVMNCLGVLGSSIASDTFRTPMFWVALGVACALLARRGAGAHDATRPAPTPLQSPAPRRLPQ